MILDRVFESYQNFAIHYKESFAHKAQKTGMIISSIFLPLIPLSPYIPIVSEYQVYLILTVLASYIACIFLFPFLYCLYYYWKALIIYDLKCWKLNDSRKHEFRDLSIRRYSDTIFKMSTIFPFGASSWRIILEYPLEINLIPYTQVSGTLNFQSSLGSTSITCTRSDYLRFSLYFRISCEVDIALEKFQISFFCEKNQGHGKGVRKATFFIDP
jgi:hypothetical protein